MICSQRAESIRSPIYGRCANKRDAYRRRSRRPRTNLTLRSSGARASVRMMKNGTSFGSRTETSWTSEPSYSRQSPFTPWMGFT